MTQPRLAVVYCGGTIGMRPAGEGSLGFASDAGDAEAEQASLQRALEQAGLPANYGWLPVQSVAVDGLAAGGSELPAIDSSAVDAFYWRCLVTTILSVPASYDGVLVLHGTDTMAYTAAALSIALAAAGYLKPVVITGSQRPIRLANGELDNSSDAVANIRDAVAACSDAASLTAPAAQSSPPVQLVFAGACLHGARCSKVHSVDDSGFAQRSPASSQPPISKLSESGDVAMFCDGVIDLVVTPGLEPSQLAHMLAAPGLKAAVIRLYGSGTINPAHLSELNVSIPLLAVSACFEGGVQVASYQASVIVSESADCEAMRPPIINGGSISPEAAMAKLMWVMADSVRARDPNYWLTINIAGELG